MKTSRIACPSPARSYYAGKTVIRATSPGLKDAMIEITSLGEPKFIPGKMPSVKPRPYVRFTGANDMMATITVGCDNPTRTSSKAPGHGGRLANDGNPATFWQAADGDANAWLSVNLEKIVTVNKTKLTFPADGNWCYKIEISDDGETNWKLLVDQTQATGAGKERVDAIQSSSPRGRFLRVTIAGTPAGQAPALAELEATGTLTAQ